MDMKDKDSFFPLLSAVMNGHLNVVRYFISQGEKVNQGNTEGWTLYSLQQRTVNLI